MVLAVMMGGGSLRDGEGDISVEDVGMGIHMHGM